MQEMSMNLFVKLVNDQDTMVAVLIPPHEGFDRIVTTMSGERKAKPHYRMHPIGDYNFNTQQHLSKPPLALTIDQVRALKPENAKIWTTPQSAVKGFQREIDKGHSIVQIRRDGVAKNTDTIYDILYAMQIDDDDWEFLLPNISKQELAKLQSEEKWDEISEEELHRLENIGVKENGQ